MADLTRSGSSHTQDVGKLPPKEQQSGRSSEKLITRQSGITLQPLKSALASSASESPRKGRDAPPWPKPDIQVDRENDPNLRIVKPPITIYKAFLQPIEVGLEVFTNLRPCPPLTSTTALGESGNRSSAAILALCGGNVQFLYLPSPFQPHGL